MCFGRGLGTGPVNRSWAPVSAWQKATKSTYAFCGKSTGCPKRSLSGLLTRFTWRGEPVDVLAPGVLALAILSMSMTGLAIALVILIAIVVAAVRGLTHPDFAYHGPASSTGGSAIVLIVNGPIAGTVGINSGNNVFGQGVRANATIGRAVRLIMMNVMNTRPGLLDRATLGNPGKYSFCFAENEENHPWEPLHVERGLRADQSAVTVYASNSLCQVYNQLAATPEPLLLCFADALCNLGTPNLRGYNQSLIVFAGEHAEMLRQGGWGKREVRAFLIQHARRTIADLKRAGRRPGPVEPGDETTWKHAFENPDDLLIVCAGSQGGSWSACLPGWGNKWTRSVTTPVGPA